MLQHAITFNIKGDSYRLREKKKAGVYPAQLLNSTFIMGKFISLKMGNFKSLSTNVISAGQGKSDSPCASCSHLPGGRRAGGRLHEKRQTFRAAFRAVCRRLRSFIPRFWPVARGRL
ncbi:hypothetical protein [Caldibacillus debilis]|uniref:hypothetical protein n=1 Tax=Caldibacillus debilis TaxID=301148 RepID=UPI002ADE7C2F|nr:hypothetical protein [Caldibacillus debilis]